jgi:septal ring-binding cell division protein DamX
MPLDIRENEEKQGPIRRGPIVQEPDVAKPLISRFVVIIFIVAVVGAMIFLAINFNILGWVGSKHTKSSVPASEETASVTESSSPSPASTKESLKTPEIKPVTPQSTGQYTIYISAFRSRSDAEGEAARWTKAGYPAQVYESGGWFRVGLGRYDAVPEARSVAEKLSVGFEQGYWIGPAR